MMIMSEMTLTELLSASLYLLTAVLLIYAVSQRYVRIGQISALGAILAIAGANTFFMMSYQGEPAIAYERPGPIKRARAGERGTFQFEDEDEDAGGTGSASGSAGSGSIAMASASSDAPEKAERQLVTGLECADCPDMVVVRPGVFRIGAAPTDLAAHETEHPTRMIGINAPFAIGRNEVTLGEYLAFAKATRRQTPKCPDFSGEDDPRLPVTCVSPLDAEAYADWLSKRTGKPFRLPSEAEWEYAARAGAAGIYATGNHLGAGDANIGGARGSTIRVGSYPANAFGINDMHGNAAEIVAGCWLASPSQLPGDGTAATSVTGCTSRVLRDAHAREPAEKARLSARRPIEKGARLPGVGFRLARDLR